MVKAVDPLTLRATEGLAHSLGHRLKGDVPVPDSTTVGRRANTLTVALPTTAQGPIHAVLNSTGLNIFGEGEGKGHQQG